MLQSVASLAAANRGESEEAASRLRNIAEMLARRSARQSGGLFSTRTADL